MPHGATVLSDLSHQLSLSSNVSAVISSSARAMLAVVCGTYCRGIVAGGGELTVVATEEARPQRLDSCLGETLSRRDAASIWRAIDSNHFLVTRLCKAPAPEKSAEWGGLLHEDTRSVLVVPLVSRDRAYGVLLLGENRSWDRKSFDESRVAYTHAIASHTVLALDRVQEARSREATLFGAIESMSRAIDAKSAWTANHSQRVSTFAVGLGREMGLSPAEIESLRLGCLLHDIGKISVSDTIIEKPGKLTSEEYAAMKAHSLEGDRILRPVPALASILPIVRNHHERWDGGGYPDGLAGHDIPLLARAAALADTFDAMTATRPHREAPGLDAALEEIRCCGGRQFDPNLTEPFIRAVQGISVPEALTLAPMTNEIPGLPPSVSDDHLNT